MAKEYQGTFASANFGATPYATTTYAYTALDKLHTVTDAQGNVTTLGYDLLGQKTSIADPDLRNWAYQYDLAGNLTRQTDARGQRICLYYDALHRLTGKHDRSDDACPTSPTLDVSYRYDEGTNGKGQRTSMTDGTGTTTWTYDMRGRVTNETKTISGYSTYTTQYAYDSLDRVTTITSSGGANGESGEVVTQSYDLGGQLSGVSGTNSYASGMTYDPLGLIKQVSRGDGSVTSYVYYGEGDPFQAAKSTGCGASTTRCGMSIMAMMPRAISITSG